ncbi:protein DETOXIFICATION 18-like isoform X1 [Prunus avium]|uniref:Protein DETOXIFICATION n=2 Tax=Prunus avium TaxID=42229 RepID=A0A6P5RH42_PRUAV|nr:protein DETOXIFICATION 18-like isoform X1 [Prunus avium]
MEMLANTGHSDRNITTPLLEAGSHGEEGTKRKRWSWKKVYLDLVEAEKQVAKKMISEGGHGEEGSKRRWWNNLLDIEEAKKQVLFSLPIIPTNVFFSLIPLVSVMFAGHLGERQLAGATLANSWANVTGFALVVGLSGALETLCGQCFGAKSYRMLGIYLQASCIISFLLCSIISIIWFYTEPLLILLHQDPQISKTAALFLKHLIPGLFAYGFLQNILRFLQTQSVYVMPMVFSVIAIVFHIGITYGLVHWTALGFLGAPLAASVSLWLSVLMLAFNVSCTKSFARTWEGFSFECFDYILTGLKLALPSATMECLEEWAFEILVLLGGLMPNSAKTSSLLAMCVNTQEIGYKITYGLIAAASTRVSNELGAGNPDRAKNAMVVTLKLSVLLSFAIILALVFGHNIWAAFFIDSNASNAVLRQDFASMTPLLAISIIVDSVQGVSSGVARGCGWQHLAVYVNLATFYLIGMTISGLLGFKFKLYAKGLWIGIICGLSFQASTLLLITLLKEWPRSDLSKNPEEGSPVLV